MTQAEWAEFFREYRPYPIRLRQWIMSLHQQKHHKTVIHCLRAALIEGQAQPWMYEVLALSMEIENYPKEDVQRVVLSLSDFGAVTFENLMYSAAYLTRFDRKLAALNLYRQSSGMSAERHEPYVLGLKLAAEVGSEDDVLWAATGILQHYWGNDFAQKHREAENAILDRIRKQKLAGMQEAAEVLESQLKQAQSRDLSIRVDWSGTADLDLEVEEPPGSVCSQATPLTIAGGIFLHDGAGPTPENCYESYVCPRGVTGPYRIRVSNAFGKVVGNRAVVTVLKHSGLPEERQEIRTVVLDDQGVGTFTIDLSDGRRTQPRDVSQLRPFDPLPFADPVARPVDKHMARKTEHDKQVLQEFSAEQLQPSRRAGAVGFAPVVQTIPEGNALSAQAVVSPDRRYVRLSLRPTMTNVTDVFTFSFLNGNRGNGIPQNGGN